MTTTISSTVPIVNVQDIYEQYEASISSTIFTSTETPHPAVSFDCLKSTNVKYENWIVRPRMLRDVSRITTNTTYLQGYQSVAVPIGIGPCERLRKRTRPVSITDDTMVNALVVPDSDNAASSTISSSSGKNEADTTVTTTVVNHDTNPSNSYNYTQTCMKFSQRMNIPCIVMDYDDLLQEEAKEEEYYPTTTSPVWIVLQYTGPNDEMKVQLEKIKQKGSLISAIVLRCSSSSSSSSPTTTTTNAVTPSPSCCSYCSTSTNNNTNEKLCTVEDIDWIWNILHTSSSSSSSVHTPSLIGWHNFTSNEIVPYISAGLDGILLSSTTVANPSSIHPFELIRPLVYTLAKTKVRTSSSSSLPSPTATNTVELYLMDDFLRGSSIFKALALGIKGVFIHHPVSWALHFQQQLSNPKNISLDLLFKLYLHEFSNTMQLCGCIRIDQIGTEYISPRPLSALAVARTFMKRTQSQEQFISPRKIVRPSHPLHTVDSTVTKNLSDVFHQQEQEEDNTTTSSPDSINDIRTTVSSSKQVWLRRLLLVGISTYFFRSVYYSLGNGNAGKLFVAR